MERDRRTMPFFNTEAPPRMSRHATPSSAIAGKLLPEVELDDTLDMLAAAGIEDDQILVLSGEDGATFLNSVGTAMSRLFSEVNRETPLEFLRDGATLIAIFDVETDDQEATAKALENAGVQIYRRFGKWTFT